MVADQPISVHEIAERLFPAYTVDGGTMHLAGCTLEDRPFVQVVFPGGGGPRELYLAGDGTAVDEGQIAALGLADTEPLDSPLKTHEAEVPALLERARAALAEQADLPASSEPPAIRIVWCKYAAGKLCFSLGGESTALGFADWARLLQPPPFVCPATGTKTFHLAATDDGRIVAAEAIEVCAETGRRVLSDELVTCSATGRHVLPETVATCPVADKPVLRKVLTPCRSCGERVSPAILHRQQCAACRTLAPVAADDPRIARLREAYPGLREWSRWRLSETNAVYVTQAHGWVQRLMVVVDKDTYGVKRLARSVRLLPIWKTVPPSQHDTYLLGPSPE
jgi:hypothetical protein